MRPPVFRFKRIGVPMRSGLADNIDILTSHREVANGGQGDSEQHVSGNLRVQDAPVQRSDNRLEPENSHVFCSVARYSSGLAESNSRSRMRSFPNTIGGGSTPFALSIRAASVASITFSAKAL